MIESTLEALGDSIIEELQKINSKLDEVLGGKDAKQHKKASLGS